ncbi:Heat shock protein DnaJ with tetratricopeptide repeat [Zea mays]|uniref:Heat shock protein DnaJ with tetratricopeptide repeat n=1 Tax=Zea mays TaxID=4577 RepID=A0A1D6M171_MAIZE|nr:Heat shock protein DnaJ with tetratricopeptide repeat [Zea mays]
MLSASACMFLGRTDERFRSRVTDWVSQCKEFLERRTSPEATKALELISNALHICPHSDSVKEMKAEALLMLRRYEEVIQLCQESVNLTERNSVLFKDNGEPKNSRVSERMQFSGRYWRPYLICKSYFLSGKLDEALELLKKHEQVTPVKESEVNTYEEKFSSLSATIRELLSLKAAGNESFQAGRYSDAVKQYSAALAWNSESRPFSAVCFCNRAAAYQALGQVTDAISDCSLAMVLDTNYPKAISRRATLYKMIRDYDQAANDVRKLISLLEKKVNVSGVSPKAFNKHNDLKQAHVRLSSIEDEAKNDTPLNLYLILGVEPSCSSEDIKKAYRKAALRHHPDKATQLLIRNENAEDGFWRDVVKEVYADADHLFKTIGEAYNVLSDPAKREEYNFEEDLRNARRRVSSSRSMHRSPEQNYSNRGFNPRQRQSSRASRSRWYSNSDDYW